MFNEILQWITLGSLVVSFLVHKKRVSKLLAESNDCFGNDLVKIEYDIGMLEADVRMLDRQSFFAAIMEHKAWRDGLVEDVKRKDAKLLQQE